MSVAETSLSHCWHARNSYPRSNRDWARLDGGQRLQHAETLSVACQWEQGCAWTEQNSCYGPDTDTTSQCVVGRKCKWGGAAPTLSLFSGSLLTRPRCSLKFDGALERNLGGIVLAAPLVPSSKSLPSPPRFTPYYKHRLIVIMYLSNYCTNFLSNLSCKAL